ncbi:unnamed protein product [Brassica oleracea var. botrytis]|uniref:Uncharacterized protein n=1 Tax=Brassica carinata TaxID=52824 RepID=A0A8X7TZP8_BRACI|nr:hypothetical protein Bca52824_079861 [Brassica carinata]
MPTVGLDMESFKYKNSSFSFVEMGGQYRYRMIPLWTHYFQQVSGFVYVVDTTDRERMEGAKSFLHMVMDEIQGTVPDNAAVLVYANKHEVPGAMTASEISNELDLASLRQRNWQRNWHVQSSCALCGDGLHEGLDWLLKNAERM